LDWTSFNLAAAFIGSIVTIFYVDVILQRHKETLWDDVRAKIFMRLERVANGITSVRVAFGHKPPNLPHDHVDLVRVRQEMIRLAEHILSPAQDGVDGMNQSNWRTLVLSLQHTLQETDRLLSSFSRNLDHEYVSLLLDMQEDAFSSRPTLPGQTCWEFQKRNCRPKGMAPQASRSSGRPTKLLPAILRNF
jgi:hypothetical protein